MSVSRPGRLRAPSHSVIFGRRSEAPLRRAPLVAGAGRVWAQWVPRGSGPVCWGQLPWQECPGLGWGGRRLGPLLSGGPGRGVLHGGRGVLHGGRGGSRAVRVPCPGGGRGRCRQLGYQVSTRAPVGPQVGGRGGLSGEGGGLLPGSVQCSLCPLAAPQRVSVSHSHGQQVGASSPVTSRTPSAGLEPCQLHTCFQFARVFALTFLTALVKERLSPRFLSCVTSLRR